MKGLHMKRIAIGCAFAAAALVTPLVASAGSPNHVGIPTPGTANCKGQAAAYLAQGNEIPGPGLGNVAVNAGFTVKDIMAAIDAFCAL